MQDNPREIGDERDNQHGRHDFDVAIIGMAGRFPGASNIDEYWQNLVNGVESVSFFSDKELRAAGLDDATLNNPNYVKAAPILEDPGLFDASFFGYSPREAQTMDPQQRLLLECAWETLEHAGYDAERFAGPIGIYAGSAMNTYLLFTGLLLQFATDYIPTLIGNDKDFLPTRVSYKLNLTGPSVAVQTACSTSLVAVHMACQSLLNHECDMALAGGVSVRVPHKVGYVYQEGSLFSPDGHCRAFDAQAQGTLFGSGVGMVLVKRLADALADGDHIHAIIKGSAINNDGSLKAGYTVPSVAGQTEVIAEALANAGVEPETISYVEAHGTGTALGDPIEITALTQAFGGALPRKNFCAIGSVKTNIGHLDAAAGIAGLIKIILALQHKQLPPSLHFEKPNPLIDFDNSPFFVNDTLRDWAAPANYPRRAGISSLGIGGTNAHVIVEEAPERVAYGPSREAYLIVLSAKTEPALDAATRHLAQHLRDHSDQSLADVAYTLQTGRKAFTHRRMGVCQNREDAIAVLGDLNPKRLATDQIDSTTRDVVMMFPGQGAQYPNMGLGLYESEPIFQQEVDRCAEILQPYLGLDLRGLLYPEDPTDEAAVQKLTNTLIAQPALFTIEYALAKLWMFWGVEPALLVGHSIGEYVAACLADVVSVEDALRLVATRGRLMQELPGGSMLAVPQSEADLQPYLTADLSIAAVNTPNMVVLSGENEAVHKLEEQLTSADIICRRLHTSHAFHSQMMEPILRTFIQAFNGVDLRPPQRPIVSTVTGARVTKTEMTNPQYWAHNLRQTVRFSDAAQVMLSEPNRVFLEVGPGNTLSTFIRQHANQQIVLPSLRHPQEAQSDIAFLLQTVGRLWLRDVGIDWTGFYAHERRQRQPLPTYPFERQRYWMETQHQPNLSLSRAAAAGKQADIADWFYVPSWKRTPLRHVTAFQLAQQQSSWLLFSDELGVGSRMAQQLQQAGQAVTTVTIGPAFTQVHEGAYTLNPSERTDYDALFEALVSQDRLPDKIVHLWTVTSNPLSQPTPEQLLDRGFYSLLFLAQALGQQQLTEPLHIAVVTTGVQEVTGDETLAPEKAPVLGPCKVIPQEYTNITCAGIDITLPASDIFPEPPLIDHLIAEIASESSNIDVAYRGHHRWVQAFEPLQPQSLEELPICLRNEGVYVITGGLGNIGQVVADYLAQTVRAKLVLVGRSGVPARGEWGAWLSTHDDQDATSRKIRNVQHLEDMGAEVLVTTADVANEVQLQAAIDLAYGRYGQVHGVIHAAGVVAQDALTTLQESTPSDCELHFQPKIHGLRVLEKVLEGKSLDFCLLFSSLSSVLGGLGHAAYAAANLFMDAMANTTHHTGKTPWISINWDVWRFHETASRDRLTGTTLANLGITPAEGRDVLQRILKLNAMPQIIISTGTLQSRIDQWVKLESLYDKSPDQATSPSPTSSSGRSHLQTAYIAPRNPVEETIASTWQELLGIEQIGIHDNFVELGGHSLLAIQIILRLREAFQVALTARELFSEPTVAQLAEHIQQLGNTGKTETDTIARMLQKVAQLSEDDVRMLLERNKEGTGA